MEITNATFENKKLKSCTIRLNSEEVYKLVIENENIQLFKFVKSNLEGLNINTTKIIPDVTISINNLKIINEILYLFYYDKSRNRLF